MIPSRLTTWPRKSTLRRKKQHFRGFNFNPLTSILSNTASSQSILSGILLAKTTTSSRFTKQDDHCSPRKTASIKSSNVAGALYNPKDITFHWKSPSLITNAKACCALSVNPTCQYPDNRSFPTAIPKRCNRL